MSEHTKGRLEAFTQESFWGWYALRDQEDREVGSGDGGFDEADARRLAACWNVFENVRTEMVEALVGIGAMGVAADAVRRLPAMESELNAARALLREVLGVHDYAQASVAAQNGEYCRDDVELGERIRNYLDACDVLGDGNG